MNWELIRIGIDVLSVLMVGVMVIVLYIAYKSYKKVSQPLGMVEGLFTNQEEEDGKDSLQEMGTGEQVLGLHRTE